MVIEDEEEYEELILKKQYELDKVLSDIVKCNTSIEPKESRFAREQDGKLVLSMG